MSFLSTPIRGYGPTAPSWWNLLRTAGVAIEAFLGAAFLGETQVTIANNQVAAADVTGLLFSGAAVRSFCADYQIYRNTTAGGATELSERGFLLGVFSTVASTWEITSGPAVGDAGVTFTITAAGQVQYTSTNITGTAATSKMKFQARTMGVES